MASQLRPEDKIKILKGVTKKVGDKPYENGYWGNNANRDYVLVELLDESGVVIDYKDLTVADAGIEVIDNNFKLLPGSHLSAFGFETGTFRIRYRFIRNLAGIEKPFLLRTKVGFEDNIFNLNSDGSNIYITDDKKIYAASEEEYKANPEIAEQLFLTNYKYEIDRISPSRTEVRLRAKNIFDNSYLGTYNYKTDFLKLQESTRTENISLPIQFYGVYDIPANFNAGEAPPVNFDISNEIEITPENGGFAFTSNMEGGTLVLPNAYLVGYDRTEVRTNLNFIPNSTFEDIVIDLNTGQPKDISGIGWDQSLHSDAVQVNNWSAGYINESSGEFVGSSAIGYHAKFVRNEGNQGGVCLKFIDQNNVFVDYTDWPTLNSHRRMQVVTEFANLDGLGAGPGDLMNISFDMKSTVLGKGVTIQAYYPGETVVEEEPLRPPQGYYDPLSPGPFESIPENPPDGFLPNNESSCNQIEPKPPNTVTGIISQYNLQPPAFAPVPNQTTTSDFGINGAGVWIVTEFSGNSVTWGPNLSDSYTKNGTLSPLSDWLWNGSQWVESGENTPASIPSPPENTVNLAKYQDFDVVNSHPFQPEGQGAYPRFRRNVYRGENRGWQTGTIIDTLDFRLSGAGVPTSLITNDSFLLIKDDLVWIIGGRQYTANYSKVHLTTFDTIFTYVHYQTTDDGNGGTHSIYEDIFKQGRIQSITRTRNLGDDDVRGNVFIVFYNDGRSTDESNKVLQVVVNSDSSSSNKGPILLKDLDQAFNDAVMNAGNDMEWSYAGKNRSGGNWRHWCCVRGTDRVWYLDDGDGDFFEITGDTWFVEGGDSGQANSFTNHFAGVANNYFDVWFSAHHSSGHWSNYSGIENAESSGGGSYIKLKDDELAGVAQRIPTADFAYGAGVVGSEGVELVFGSRNPGASNYNSDAVYDDGSSEFDFDENPLKEGSLSPQSQWEWDGYQWNSIGGPPTFAYQRLNSRVYSTEAGSWGSYETEIEIPENWNPLAKWYLYIRGHDSFNGDGLINGTVWVDNLSADFTLTNSEVTTPRYRDFVAKITTVYSGTKIRVDKNYNSYAEVLFADDPDGNNLPIENTNPITFDNFRVSYLVYNPFDLRTYLKLGNQMFLTTNFKKDRVSNGYPFSVVYKLYEPLPDNVVRLDEVVVVKEMADMVEESVRVVDFVDSEVGDMVLKTPDLSNVESPVQRVSTNYRTRNDILTQDSSVAESLRNEFLSQSVDSVDINVDYSRFENFINFSSVRSRIENFKYKLEQIEAQTVKSASFVGISGSLKDTNKALNEIRKYKNGFDGFEKYMYFQSSSYVTSSLGEFFDNSWPKTSGNGTFESPYVLAHTTSSEGKSWYNEQISSASNYDTDNLNKLSSLLPEHIKFNSSNQTYLRMTDMFGQHFDEIWIYIKALGDIYDRREKLTEGISRDLLESVAKSLGWQLNDGKANISLTRFALGKEVTGSYFSNYSTEPERDVSREIWSRIINNMPFFLKNKGTVRAIKGLINAYGIPSTILRVREYGGPDLPDNAVPQFEIGRKFTRALGFRGSQFVKTTWSDDSSTGRKPDTIEFRFKSPTGSNQILVEKVPVSPNISSSFYVRLKDNNLPDNYGHVSFQISGSDGMKEITSSNLPIYDNDFYSVMVRRVSGSDNHYVTQSFELSVGKYDAGRSKIHLYSTSRLTMPGDLNADSASYNLNWENDGTIFIGGDGDDPLVGVQLSGSIMEYRHWTEVLNTGSFKNHIANPKAYNGNSLSSSYENLVLRYSFEDNKNLNTDTDGIRDVSANQDTAYSGSHSGFTGNFFHTVVDETKTHIPSIGALRRVSNKIRIESNNLKKGQILSYTERATKSAYDLAPVDRNKIGVYFAPTDVINTDIIESVADLNFDNFLGDPRDIQELEYRGLKGASNNYWKKYKGKNDFWDYIRLLKYYDQSLFTQVRKMIPARAKPNLGVLVEPNIFERPKVIIGKDPVIETPIYRDTIKVMEDFVQVTSSYNHDRFTVTDYDSYNSTINLFNLDAETADFSMSADYKTFNSTINSFLDDSFKNTLWQRIGQEGAYKSGSVTFGDVKFGEVLQPVISGSRVYGRNQVMEKFFSTKDNAFRGIFNSSSFKNTDLDNLAEDSTAFFNSYYFGVKNTKLTTFDGGPPIEVTLTSPTKLVKSKGGESTLDTGEGKVAKFLPKRRKRKGGFFRVRPKTKPTSIEKAIKQAEDEKGGFLNLVESQEVIEKFNKDNNIKKKKKKK